MENEGIAWREWCDAAFAEARERDVPVLLDIGAVWCHWCHVMDHGIPGDPVNTGTYSDPTVQRLIAESFVPIKVDNDRRPDINARYNMGGWPTTVFLTADGDTLYGETYVPPQRMISLLEYIADYHTNHRAELDAMKEQTRQRRAASEAKSVGDELDPETTALVAAAIRRNFDPVYGGFGDQPKFPHPDVLLFALEQAAITGDATLKAIAEKTLDGMANGGMYDQFAGGFFRYSTTRDWAIPHYEKMLEDNARLTVAYTLASEVVSPDYLDVVRTAHEWLFTTMRDSQTGLFAGSQDADEEERYYGQPLDARATMPTPYIDWTTYADWNALMVSSLVARYRVTGEAEILAAAVQTYDSLRTALAEDNADGVVLHHYRAGAGSPAGGPGLLDDQTTFGAAALDLYEATGRPAYLADARGAANWMLAHPLDSENGGFYDVRPAAGAIGELARPKQEMGENADAALLLTRLAAITDQVSYREAAQQALRTFVGEYRHVGYFAAGYARAVQAVVSAPLHVVVVGEPGADATQALLRTAWSFVYPGKAVKVLSEAAEAGRRGFPAGERPLAYVCVGTECKAPVAEAEALVGALRDAVGSRR